MKLSSSDKEVVSSLLLHEHQKIAMKIGFIDTSDVKIDSALLNNSVDLIDKLSRVDNEIFKRYVVTLASILWTYRNPEWIGIKDFLLVTLSRCGYCPSTLMIDESFSEGKYSEVDSIWNQYSIALHHLDNEIFINESKFLLTAFQKDVWRKMSQLKLLGISAPTSAGKSYIILLKCIDLLARNGGNVIYIVPTLSLIAQVSADFKRMLDLFKLNDYVITTTFNASDDNSGNRIYILTQEKALAAFGQIEVPFNNIRALVVDEVQNLERVSNEDDQRAKTLYDTLIELRYTCQPELTIISGPRIDGLKALGTDIFQEENSDESKTKDSPVASFTYAVSKRSNKYYFRQYCDILDTPNSLQIKNDTLIKGYGKSLYKDDFIEYLFKIVSNLGADSVNLLFSPTTSQARNTAVKLAALNSNLPPKHEKRESLVRYIKDTVHENYDMCSTIPKGYVYHHGKTPSHVRAVLETAIKDKVVNNVVCTTTLMQGVNLPAQNVIMRNPYLSIKTRDGLKPKLTDYEIANLRGRAGRLLKDFIGRTFVLEEGAFDTNAGQENLFKDSERKLKSGYGELYTDYREDIQAELVAKKAPSIENKEYAFLLTYIRQTVLKHGEKAKNRLTAVGIKMDDKNLEEVSKSLKDIEVPKDICLKNRYWDPFDLNRLFLAKNRFSVPSSIQDNKIENKLNNSLSLLSKEFSVYYEKYFGVSNNLLFSSCISAKDWMKEHSLKEILNRPFFDSSDKIEDRIALIQNKISYGLTMLMKPLYDMENSQSMFLRFIEIGAYKPVSRKLIELNVPRETAIYISDNFFNKTSLPEENSNAFIIERLRDIAKELDYWRLVQVQNML